MTRNNVYRGYALRIAVGITMLILLLTVGATATTSVTGCGMLSKAEETYVLSNDISASGTCFTIGADNITLDGNGHTITGSDIDNGVYLNGRTGVTIKKLNAKNFDYGIHLYYSSNNTLSGNNVSNGGIYLSGSNNNTLSNNNASNSYYGIYLNYSSNNMLSNNNAANNRYKGIYLYINSDNNMLNGNNVSNNDDGISLQSYSKNNMLNGNNAWNNYGGIHLESDSDNNTLINNNAWNNYGGISLGSSNNTLINNNAWNNSDHGIGMGDSSNNMLINNNASNSYNGIYMYHSSNNTLTNNNVWNNNYGINIYFLYYSDNNVIYNNFFNNTNNFIITNSVNSWNITKTNGKNIIGGPYLGGNFWASLNGTGFSQTCTDADGNGICDSSYILDANNIDYLPLSMNFTTDNTPPISITNLRNQSYASNYINWTWNDSTSPDFDKLMVYINGIFKNNVSKGKQYYNATGLIPNISYRISTHTVDTSGNINKTWKNHTARTAPDSIPPRSITNLTNKSYAPTYIKWIWTDPSDYDFTKVMIYINGIFKTNVSKGIKYYNATGLTSNTSYRINTHTVDTSGNLNKTWVNHTARTTKGTVSPISPKVILAFDDGWTSQYYKAFPIMQANHQNGTAFIITGDVAGASGQPGMEYMNLSQLKALYNAGWDLSSHTVTHPDLTTLTPTTLNNELSTSKNWLNNSGFTKASRFLAYPYGTYNTTVISALQANGYLAARTVKPDPLYPQFTLSSPSIYELPTLIVQGVPGYGDPATPPAYIQNQINNTIASNGLLIITFSNIEDACCVSGVNAPEEYKTSDFKIISDFLKSKEDIGQLDVVTMSEYFGISI